MEFLTARGPQFSLVHQKNILLLVLNAIHPNFFCNDRAYPYSKRRYHLCNLRNLNLPFLSHETFKTTEWPTTSAHTNSIWHKLVVVCNHAIRLDSVNQPVTFNSSQYCCDSLGASCNSGKSMLLPKIIEILPNEDQLYCSSK